MGMDRRRRKLGVVTQLSHGGVTCESSSTPLLQKSAKPIEEQHLMLSMHNSPNRILRHGTDNISHRAASMSPESLCATQAYNNVKLGLQ